MIIGTIFLFIMYLILKYVLTLITYVNKLDTRLGDSTWRWTYDYQVIGERDFSDLDDKNFVRLVKAYPQAKRVDKVKGIHQAHIEAAKLVNTEMFWVYGCINI